MGLLLSLLLLLLSSSLLLLLLWLLLLSLLLLLLLCMSNAKLPTFSVTARAEASAIGCMALRICAFPEWTFLSDPTRVRGLLSTAWRRPVIDLIPLEGQSDFA